VADPTRRIQVTDEGKSEERETTSDDVEAHSLLDAPPSERPPADRNDEGDDVEAHVLSEAPPSE